MDFDKPDELDVPSKTQRKKEAHAQQELGVHLTELPDSRLTALPLSEPLMAAIREFKRIPPKRGAVKRQLQFIGRLIRDCDTDAIERALELQTMESERPAIASAAPSKVEQYCEQIISRGDAGIQALLEAEPMLDRQQLRQLLRNFKKAPDNKRDLARNRIREYLETACD